MPAFIPGAIILSPTSIPVLSATFTVVELLTAPLTVVLAAVGLGMSKSTEHILQFVVSTYLIESIVPSGVNTEELKLFKILVPSLSLVTGISKSAFASPETCNFIF